MPDQAAIDLVARDVGLTAALQGAERAVADFAKRVTNEGKRVDLADGAEKSSKDMQKHVKEATDKTQGMFEGWGGKIKGIIAAIGIAVVANKIIDFGKELVKMGSEAQDASDLLEGMARATGNASGFSVEQLKLMADQMQEVTRFEGEMVMGAQAAMLSFKNVRGDNFAEAIELSGDLATLLKTDLTGAAQIVGKALNDPAQSIRRLKEAGIAFTEEELKTIEAMADAGNVAGAQALVLDKLRSHVGGLAEEMGGNAGGAMARFTNKLGDVGEEIGKSLLPAIDAALPVFDSLMDWAISFAPAIAEIATGFVILGQEIANSMKPAFEWLLDAGVTIFTGLEIAVTHWQDILELMGIKAAYIAVRTYEQIKYFFGDVIPELLSWFANNWIEIFVSLQTFQATVLINMGKNVWEFVKGVKGYLTGNGGGFKFHALLEGFEMTVKEFPHILEREEGTLEKSLRESMERRAEDLQDAFGNAWNSNKGAVKDFIAPPRAAKPTEEDLKPTENNTPYEDLGKGPKEEKASKETSGLEDLAKKISLAAATTPEDKVKSAVELASEEQQAKQQETTDAVKALGQVLEEAVAVAETEPDLAGSTPGLATIGAPDLEAMQREITDVLGLSIGIPEPHALGETAEEKADTDMREADRAAENLLAYAGVQGYAHSALPSQVTSGFGWPSDASPVVAAAIGGAPRPASISSVSQFDESLNAVRGFGVTTDILNAESSNSATATMRALSDAMYAIDRNQAARDGQVTTALKNLETATNAQTEVIKSGKAVATYG